MSQADDNENGRLIRAVIEDVERVEFGALSSGEWEIRMVREEADDIYHYTRKPDLLYEQLLESGDLRERSSK